MLPKAESNTYTQRGDQTPQEFLPNEILFKIEKYKEPHKLTPLVTIRLSGILYMIQIP